MLLPNSNNLESAASFIVLSITPEDIIIPAYPEDGDMVMIQGENDELWHAHVLSTDKRMKICKVHFYIKDATTPRKYIRETTGRMATETIHWNTIVKDVSRCGHWLHGSWYTTA